MAYLLSIGKFSEIIPLSNEVQLEKIRWFNAFLVYSFKIASKYPFEIGVVSSYPYITTYLCFFAL